MQKMTLIGNLVADPAQVTTSNNKTFTKFRIAVNRRFTGANGEKVTDFFQITAFGKIGENCQKFLAKGRKVAIIGELQARTYEDSEGMTRMALDVVADEVEFLTPKDAKETANLETKPVTADDFQDIQSDDIPF